MGNKSFTKEKNPGLSIVYKWAMTCTPYKTCGPTKHLTCKDYAIHRKPIMIQFWMNHNGGTKVPPG